MKSLTPNPVLHQQFLDDELGDDVAGGRCEHPRTQKRQVADPNQRRQEVRSVEVHALLQVLKINESNDEIYWNNSLDNKCLVWTTSLFSLNNSGSV